jgi:hypothetical protein
MGEALVKRDKFIEKSQVMTAEELKSQDPLKAF